MKNTLRDNQEILKASKNNHNSSKALRRVCSWLVRILWGRSTSSVIYDFVIQVISEKTMPSKAFTSKFETYLYMKVIVIINNYKYFKLSCKFVFVKLQISFLFCLRNKKQKSSFNQVGGLVTRNVFVFCLSRVERYFKAIPNLADLYFFFIWIFLHVIPVRIIVLWYSITSKYN